MKKAKDILLPLLKFTKMFGSHERVSKGTRFLEVRTKYTKTDVRQYARQKQVTRKEAAQAVRLSIEKGNAILLANAAKGLVKHKKEKAEDGVVIVSTLPVIDDREDAEKTEDRE